MAKLPLDDPKTGIHRAKMWEIGFYALNNTSTNLYMVLMGSIAYFLMGIVGVGSVIAGSLVTIMRIWDGVTDPFIGMLVDNTNTKFGKNRPFIVAGNVILFVTSFLIFRIIPMIPEGARFITYIVIYMCYVIGYTFQCVVTKSAQTCLTNDPKQRPIFTMFDASYNTIAMSIIWPIYMSGTLAPRFTITSATEEGAAKLDAMAGTLWGSQITTNDAGIRILNFNFNPEYWQFIQLVLGGVAAVFAICAIIGLSRKDNPKYYGVGSTSQKIGVKDYIDVIAHNRGIQMLVVAASSDKLCLSIGTNATVLMCIYGIIFGSYTTLNGAVSAITGIPVVLFGIFGIGSIARNLGQKKCLVVGTYGGLVSLVAIAVLMVIGGQNAAAVAAGTASEYLMKLPAFSLTNPATWGGLFLPSNWSLIGLLWILAYICFKGFTAMSGNIVVPMTADCADYEVYRSKRYVPGLMGTLFSFVDKLISSFAATIVSLMFAIIGYTSTMPTNDSPYSTGILIITIICFVGWPAFGLLCNVVAMKFYPLDKEYMESIQSEIAEIKKAASNS